MSTPDSYGEWLAEVHDLADSRELHTASRQQSSEYYEHAYRDELSPEQVIDDLNRPDL